jgi:hypothetical protein
MTFAIVYVLPEPVTPSSVWQTRPSFSPCVRRSIASGWSPAGAMASWETTASRVFALHDVFASGEFYAAGTKKPSPPSRWRNCPKFFSFMVLWVSS